MGSITAYEIEAGRRYRVRWRDDQQKQVDKKGFRTRKEAELSLAHTEVSRSNGSYTGPGEARITVGALCSTRTPTWSTTTSPTSPSG